MLTIATKSLDYAAGVIVRSRRGKFRVLVMKTTKLFGEDAGLELWQFPGGMEEIVDQGNPYRTLDGELREETGFCLRENYKDPELLINPNAPDGHVKRFYLVWREGLRGEMRAVVMNDAKKRLEPPVWKSVDFLKKNLCDTHRGVLPFLAAIDLRIKGLK